MTIALLVMTREGRDCIEQTIPSALDNLVGPITERYIHDDSPSSDHADWLAERFPDFTIIGRAGNQGFGGAIRSAWDHLTNWSLASHVFHLEDDFTFNRSVDLNGMAEVLDRDHGLVQMALRRQAWTEDERAAGGVIERFPGDFAEVTDGEHVWLEHRRWFTTNPSLYRIDLCKQMWPRGDRSEGAFTHQLLASPKVKFGYWGALDSGEWVHHIGAQRVGTGY